MQEMGHGEDALQGHLSRLEGQVGSNSETMTDNQMTMKKRDAGLDLIKVLACLGVVALHTIYPGKSIINQIITLFAATSIPLFFMVSGYLMFRRETFGYKYVLKKILRILLVCLVWEFLHAVAYLLYYRQLRDFLVSYVLDFFQQGLFFHFWYMGALILVYLAMPLLYRLAKTAPNVYVGFMVALVIICSGIDLASIIVKRQFIMDVPQNLRYWTWLLYATVGGYVACEGNLVKRYDALTGCTKILSAFLLLLLASAWQFVVGKSVFKQITIEAYYGAFPVMLAATSVFLLCRSAHFSEENAKRVTYLSKLTMGIYIIHPFVLAVLDKFIPAFTQSGALMNVSFWALTTMISGIGTAICIKIPIMKQLMRL